MDNLEKEVSHLIISQCNTKSSYPIPIDLIIDIFSRLPAKSIARFRCLSKIWASILRSSDFTELFLTRSSSPPRLLFNFKIEDTFFFFSSPQPQNPNENSSLVAIADYYTSFPTKDSYGISRPVNSLVCNQDPATMISNPTTGQFITIPNLGTRSVDSNYCFGYDPIENQYKVLCNSWSINGTHKHQVLTLGDGNLSWRLIECCRPHYHAYDGICINGVLYYIASVDKSSEISMIACLDLNYEKFRFVNKPRGFEMGRYSTLMNCNGKLGAVYSKMKIGTSQRSDGSDGFLKLWILEDVGKGIWRENLYGVPYTWRVVIKETDVYFAGMTSSGEFVLSPHIVSDVFYVFYYNPAKNSVVRVEIQGVDGFKGHKVNTSIDYIEDYASLQELISSL